MLGLEPCAQYRSFVLSTLLYHTPQPHPLSLLESYILQARLSLLIFCLAPVCLFAPPCLLPILLLSILGGFPKMYGPLLCLYDTVVGWHHCPGRMVTFMDDHAPSLREDVHPGKSLKCDRLSFSNHLPHHLQTLGKSSNFHDPFL
jgi:hypothetical protein